MQQSKIIKTINKNTIMRCFLLFLCLFFINFSLLLGQTKLPLPKNDIEDLNQRLNNAKTGKERADILNSLVTVYFSKSSGEAKKFAEQALKEAEAENYIEGIQKSCNFLGDLYLTQGESEMAINYFTKALKIKQNSGDEAGIAEGHHRIGTAYVVKGDNELAVESFQKSLVIREKLKDKKGITNTLTNLGVVYYKEGNYNEAIRYHRQALEIADAISESKLIMTNLYRLGENFFKLKDYYEAKRSYEQQEFKAKKENNKIELQRAYLGLSQVSVAQEDYKKAFQYHQEYVKLKESIFKDQQTDTEDVIKSTDDIIKKQTQERELLAAQNRISELLILVSAIFIVSSIILIIFLYRNNRQKVKINQLLGAEKSGFEQQNIILEAQKSALEQQKLEIERKSKESEERKNQIEAQNEAINRKNEALEATFKEIERKNKDITASINYAKRIQESLLPTQQQMNEGLKDYFVLFRPRDIVSGDLYWFAYKHGKIFIAVLDCTGHGVPGAIMSMLGDSYLNQVINLQGITDAEWILNELHQSIGSALNQEETKNQDGMDVALCVIDPRKNTVEYAGAARPLLFVQDGEMKSYESCKLPIGGFQKDRERVFQKYTLKIDKPTCFYIFSDGFQDQFGGPKGRKFSKHRLDDLLLEHHHETMQEQRKILNKTLIDWMGENRQMDDILVIGFRMNPS